MEFTPLTSEPLHEQAYVTLRNALLTGRLAPGQSPTIRGLGASLGISATPVREALQRLIAEGALELAPNRTIQVPVMTRSRFVEVTEIRLRLECFAAEAAAARADEALCDRLQMLSERMHAAIAKGRFPDYLADNQSFHFLIYEASGLPYLQQLIGLCWLRTGPWLNRLAQEGRFHAIANEEHDNIITALRRGDVQAVSEATSRDISEAGTVLIELLPT
ncbi:GntR family transcriptional regulator [Shinella daejeonensis]|uniref:GntR family transcriptional regulator n=1 Tax=Shinella daejeonensis TaxID=659017 RepID=UPI0020C828D2|nr:GntR family transcriptional regulator [Shinella daejeonensis]MCP8896869.1 GntR family transcriptional regulator [Shinella daejeonensis]